MARTFEFFFDPVCPWTWATSRWLVDATSRTGDDVQWRNLSLAVVNADQDIPEQYRQGMEASARAHRVIAALREAGRNDLIGEFYTEWGRRVFHDGVTPTNELAAEVARAVGADDVAAAADDASRDAEVERSTEEGQELAGGSDVGSPVFVVEADGQRAGLFGPIVSPPPRGEEASALLEQVVASATTPWFFELKRGRQRGPEPGPRP